MEKRLVLFLALSFALLMANSAILRWLNPPPPPAPKPPAQAQADADRPAGDDGQQAAQVGPGAAEANAEQPALPQLPDAAIAAAPNPEFPERWLTLGSLDPDSDYRMLVTLTARGAAIERLELNCRNEFGSPKYFDLDDRTGYLGHLASEDVPERGGCRVRMVGPGTPAAAAGVQPGDVIVGVNERPVASAAQLEAVLDLYKPGTTVEVRVRREGKEVPLSARLSRHPLDLLRPERDAAGIPNDEVPVVRPGEHDPLSLLVTLEQIGVESLDAKSDELDGVDLLSANWEVAQADGETAEFRRTLPSRGLELVKRFRLVKGAAEERRNPDARLYHLQFELEIRNASDTARPIAYRLDGPTGLPNEGAWYAVKTQRTWSTGLRDVVLRQHGSGPEEFTSVQIADGKQQFWTNPPLGFAAVDAQYFAAALIPQAEPQEIWFAKVEPRRVGAVPSDAALKKATNVSYRLTSTTEKLQPGESLKRTFELFAGPKRPALLAQYGPETAPLADLVYYGWYSWVAKPMVWILHFFKSIVGVYGLAIIMLTILVKGLMFPVTRKQLITSQKMQLLAPEIKRLREKYKQPEQLMKAQQKLMRDHNVSHLSGCLPALIQIPIFVGLYRSLAVDVELRQAPLLGSAIRWCSNLAAPDMFWDWRQIHMPDFITRGTGFFGLGPYFNVLPIVTIVLFIWQQKLFMPPPTDEQSAMQQKMMKWMMIFMAFMFYKVASGLCLYFIASSLWGIFERKVLLKKVLAAIPKAVESGRPVPALAGNGSVGPRRERERK